MKDSTTGKSEHQHQTSTPAIPQEAVVLDSKKKKKKSSHLRSLQDSEVALSKSGSKMAKALKRGLDTWIEERDKSAEKRKDGAIRDFPKNFSKAFREFSTTAVEAPIDLLDEWADSKTVRRMFKF